MASLNENISRAIVALDGVRDKAAIPMSEPVEVYPRYIGDNPVVNPTWFPIKELLENDSRPYRKKVTFLILSLQDTLNISFTNPYVKPDLVVTSDGKEYINGTTGTTTWNFAHTWDKTKDLPCTEAGVENAYSTRYLTIYYSNDIPDTDIIPLEHVTNALGAILYYVVDTIQIGQSYGYGGFGGHSMLKVFDLINGAAFKVIGDKPQFFSSNVKMEYYPEKLVIKGTNTVLALFQNNLSLRSIKLGKFAPDATIYTNLFTGCQTLQFADIDCSNAETITTPFIACSNLLGVILRGLKVGVDISGCYLLNRQALLTFRDYLGVPNGAQTIVLGTQLKNKLTPQDKAEWEALGWTLT